MNWRLMHKAEHQCWVAWIECVRPWYVSIEPRPCTSVEFDSNGTLYRMEGRTRIRVGKKRR